MKVTYTKTIETSRYGSWKTYRVSLDGRYIGTVQNQEYGYASNWTIIATPAGKTNTACMSRKDAVETLIAASGVEV